MVGFLERLFRVGVREGMSPREAKLALTINAIALGTLLQALALFVLTLAVGLTIIPYVIASTVIGYLVGCVLLIRQRPFAARVVLAAFSIYVVGVCAVLLGPDADVDLFYLVAIAIAWLVWPRLQQAVVVTTIAVVAYVVVLVLYRQITPLDPLPPSARGWFPYVIDGSVLSALIGYAYWSAHETARADELLQRERERSDRLLRNVLPEAIAERLKASPGAIAERFPEATVLFADIVGFTPLTQKLPAERVVAILDELFSAFDDIAAAHGLEKIKTIGDAYMVVGGVPAPRDDHAAAVASMALEMRAAIARLQPELRLRIGIDTGPVVAGVIGKQKFLYDLWGDTVNTASRMESHGVVDEVHVTEAAYERLRDRFELEPRGPIQVKGKGEMSTYLVKRPLETT